MVGWALPVVVAEVEIVAVVGVVVEVPIVVAVVVGSPAGRRIDLVVGVRRMGLAVEGYYAGNDAAVVVGDRSLVVVEAVDSRSPEEEDSLLEDVPGNILTCGFGMR